MSLFFSLFLDFPLEEGGFLKESIRGGNDNRVRKALQGLAGQVELNDTVHWHGSNQVMKAVIEKDILQP